MDWHEIWEQKGAAELSRYYHETLIALDGFDGGAGRLSTTQFREIASLVVRELGLRPGVRLLDVGCGSGALLWCLRDLGLSLLGVDYSATLIEHARAAIPEATFAIAEATHLPFRADAIVCHSVFQYFPDYDYAKRVLVEFRRVASVALIIDIPDLATREAAEKTRRSLGSKQGTHLYYSRSFFGDAKVRTNDLPGYGNAPFRFNVLLNFRSDVSSTQADSAHDQEREA